MRVAVVGSGIAGLSAAWLLSTQHEVTLYEKSAHLGMDAHSLDIETPQGSARVDVPLRVFFEGFYPNIAALYQELGVEFAPINYSASFGLLGKRSHFRFDNYKLGRLSIPFLKGAQSLNRTSLRIGWESLRFFRRLPRELAKGIADKVTLEDFLAQHHYSKAFCEGFLYPAFSGICTCSHESIRSYPAKVILEYLNSDLLFKSVKRVTRGTQEVVSLLAHRVHALRLDRQVTQVTATPNGLSVTTESDSREFDHVVMATQANQTRQLLSESFAQERAILDAFCYEPSRVVVHSDLQLAPPGGPQAWAPVNFLLSDPTSTPMATIWLNAIQSMPGSEPIFQSWNPIIDPEPNALLGEAHFERPVVTAESLKALADLEAIHRHPDRRLWFCGSYASHGIPLLESAAHSAFSVAERLGCTRPWHENLAPPKPDVLRAERATT